MPLGPRDAAPVLPVRPIRSVPRALASLAGRRIVRVVLAAARATGDEPAIVGGAVRDAFLGRRGGDLDLVLPADRARAFSEALAARLGTRVLSVGAPPRAVLKVPCPGGEIDVWARDGEPEADLLRRDFTVNALRVSLPSTKFEAAPGALADLAAGRLRLPRPGVLLEDPLRVLRAARFGALLGFRLDRSAAPEARAAARRLAGVAPERRLAEILSILGAGGENAAGALERLERWGALAPLLPSVPPRTRRFGIARVRALDPAAPGAGEELSLATFLSPLGAAGAGEALGEWRASRLARRLADTLAVVSSLRARGRGAGPIHRSAVTLVRRAGPFAREAVAFLEALGRAGAEGGLRDPAERARWRALGRACRPLVAPRVLGRILSPRRPIDVAEAAELAGGLSGPALGALLEALDTSLATGEVRGAREARAFCEASRRAALPRPL